MAVIRPPGLDAEELVGVGEGPVAVDQHHGVDALAAPHLLLRGRNAVQVELARIDDRHGEILGRVVGGVAAVVELHQLAVQQRLVVELVGKVPQRRKGDARRRAVAVVERHFVHTLHEENPFAGLFETVDGRKAVVGPRARLHRREHDALEGRSVTPVAVAFGVVAVGVVHLGHDRGVAFDRLVDDAPRVVLTGLVDGQRRHHQSAVADLVPVGRRGVEVEVPLAVERAVERVVPNGLLGALLRRVAQPAVEPVVADAHAVGHLGSVEEVGCGVPVLEGADRLHVLLRLFEVFVLPGQTVGVGAGDDPVGRLGRDRQQPLAGDFVDQILGRERLVGVGHDALVEFLQVGVGPGGQFRLDGRHVVLGHDDPRVVGRREFRIVARTGRLLSAAAVSAVPGPASGFVDHSVVGASGEDACRRDEPKQFFQYLHGCKVFCSQTGECPARRPGAPPDSGCQRFSVSCMQRTDMPAARPPPSFHVPCDVR